MVIMAPSMVDIPPELEVGPGAEPLDVNQVGAGMVGGGDADLDPEVLVVESPKEPLQGSKTPARLPRHEEEVALVGLAQGRDPGPALVPDTEQGVKARQAKGLMANPFCLHLNPN